jgi:HSP20 family protein
MEKRDMSSLIRYYNPLDRAFDRALGALLPSVNADNGAGRAIALDVVETPDAYIVKAELPGIAKDKIEVNVEDRDVTIGAEFLDEVEASGKTLWKERTFSKVSRSIRLRCQCGASQACRRRAATDAAEDRQGQRQADHDPVIPAATKSAALGRAFF